MYSISIYDTNQSRGKELEKLLECYFSVKRLHFRIRRFSYASEIIRASGYTDIVFVSIEDKDPGMIEMSAALLKEHPNIYLYVLSDKYTYLDDVMDLKAFRYLKNPVDKNRLFSSLDIILDKPKKISFMSDYVSVTLEENEVVCIYTAGRKTYVLTDSGSSYPTTLSVKEWLEKTKNFKNFVSPHYSYIVNIDYVWDFSSKEITLKCKTGKIMKVFPSQRKIGEFKSIYYSRSR